MANGGWSTFSAAGSKGRGFSAAFCPARIGKSCGQTGSPILRRATRSRPIAARASSCAATLRHGPSEVIAALARGEAVEPSRYYFRTVMRFETADPALAWLNRILALGTGAREKLAVRLDVYEVV
jgi:Protein of unknown function (DUF3237)